MYGLKQKKLFNFNVIIFDFSFFLSYMLSIHVIDFWIFQSEAQKMVNFGIYQWYYVEISVSNSLIEKNANFHL